jgi:hypothetical protein
MKDSQLFLIVGILLTIDIVIMTTWQVFDPFFRDTYDLRPYVSFPSNTISRARQRTEKKEKKCFHIQGNSDGSGCKVIYELELSNI